MDYKETLWQKIFSRIYLIAISNLLWLVGLVVGLGAVGLIPSSIAVIHLWQYRKDPSRLIRANLWRDFWQVYGRAIRTYWKESGLLSLSLLIILTTVYYLSHGRSVEAMLLFYLNTISFILLCLVGEWFIYLSACFETYSQIERLRNALSYTLARMGELIIFKVFFWTGMALLWRISPGFIVLAGPGIFWCTHAAFYEAITSGKGFNQFRHYWRRDD